MLAAITWYEWFKTAHVLAAVVWVGGGTIVMTFGEAHTIKSETVFRDGIGLT
jgi:uncharacterized membrane protein